MDVGEDNKKTYFVSLDEFRDWARKNSLPTMFSETGESFRFPNLKAITDKEVEKLLLEISSKVLKLLKKHGYLNHQGEMVNHPLSDSLFRDHKSLAMGTSSSIVGCRSASWLIEEETKGRLAREQTCSYLRQNPQGFGIRIQNSGSKFGSTFA